MPSIQITEGVIGQIIVLCSIIAGFALATTAQTALSSDDLQKHRPLMNALTLISLHAILAITSGILFLLAGDAYHREVLGIATIILLAITLIRFVTGLDRMASLWLGGTRWALWIIVVQMGIIFVIVIALSVVLAGAFPPTTG